jgi:hypothetical protein
LTEETDEMTPLKARQWFKTQFPNKDAQRRSGDYLIYLAHHLVDLTITFLNLSSSISHLHSTHLAIVRLLHRPELQSLWHSSFATGCWSSRLPAEARSSTACGCCQASRSWLCRSQAKRGKPSGNRPI